MTDPSYLERSSHSSDSSKTTHEPQSDSSTKLRDDFIMKSKDIILHGPVSKKHNNRHLTPSPLPFSFHNGEGRLRTSQVTPSIMVPLKDIYLRRISLENLNLSPCFEDLITILAEPDVKAQGFTIHRELLCHFSPYFKELFSGGETNKVFSQKVKALAYNNELDFETRARHEIIEEGEFVVDIKVKIPPPAFYRLPEDLGLITTAVFAGFVEWLYRASPGRPFPSRGFNIDAGTLIHLWVLAGRLGVPACQNDCIFAIERLRRQRNTIETSQLKWVYDNTKEYKRGQCGLRNLLVDQCASALDENWLLDNINGEDNADQCPKECLVDIVSRLRTLIKTGRKYLDSLMYIEQRRDERYLVVQNAPAV